jgi:hypothetical protein
MNELQAQTSPTSMPCNSSTAPADVQFAPLQLTVANISQTMVDLSNSGLRIEFVVDPGGAGSAGSLILSQYSSGQLASGSPAPSFPVEASPAQGTAWSITQTEDAPCAFLAVPESGAGQLAAPGPGQAGGSVSFLFINVAVDLVPGASPVTVTVLPGSTATVANTPLINKTAPALGAWLTASPELLIPSTGDQSTLTWTTVGAGTCELDWDQASTVVAYNGQTVPKPWTSSAMPPPPLQVTGAAPVTATLFQDEQFSLIAQGGGAQVPAVQVVSVVAPTFTASAVTVSPYFGFTLSWTCYDGTNPTLTWQTTGDVSVVSGSGATITQGARVSLSDTAAVTISAETLFTLHVSPGVPPPPVQVSVLPVTLSNFTSSNLQVVPGSGDGQQTAILTWTAQNATKFTITGSDGSNSGNLDYSRTSYPVNLPNPPVPVTYTITAYGYAPGVPQPSLQQTVVPIPVHGLQFFVSPGQVIQGSAVNLTWSAAAATGFTVSYPGTSISLPANVQATTQFAWFYPSTTYTITAHGYTGGGAEPSASQPVAVTKRKEKEKEKEIHVPKEFKDGLEPMRSTASLGSGSGSDAGMPSGTQEAFIDPDERPDPGAGLRGLSSG